MALLGAPMFRCQILVVGVGFQSAFWEWENLNTIYAKEVVGHYKLYTLTIWLDAQTKDTKNPIHVKLLFQISLFFMFSAYVFFFFLRVFYTLPLFLPFSHGFWTKLSFYMGHCDSSAISRVDSVESSSGEPYKKQEDPSVVTLEFSHLP